MQQVDSLALILAHATPHPVGLSDSEGMSSALDEDRTGSAHSLRRHLARFASRATLALGVEERIRIFAAAGSEQLPVPDVRMWSWESRNVSHVSSSP